jgi:hypothetical protein
MHNPQTALPCSRLEQPRTSGAHRSPPRRARSTRFGGHRRRTRLPAFLLALTTFAASELVSLGAVSAERNDVSGMEFLDASPCADDGAAVAC